MLAEEGLELKGELNLYHTLDLLHDVIGLDELKKRVKRPLNDLEFACHYGCHLIRPADCGRPDHSEHPEKMENILKVLNLKVDKSLNYPEKLNCCGGPLILNLPDSALTKTGQKLQAVAQHQFNGLTDLCPWGHRLFDARQKNAADTVGTKLEVPVFYLTQLIGLAFDIDPVELGLHLNLSPIDKIDGLEIFPRTTNGTETDENSNTNSQTQASPESTTSDTTAKESTGGGQ
jgi:succinate dehydrogenase / fumarate reductase cytochrome b subunit